MAKIKAKAIFIRKQSQEKAEKRLQKALERQIEKGVKAAEKRKHLCSHEAENRAGPVQQVAEPALDLDLLVDPGPSTSFRASRSLSLLPLDAELYKGTRVSPAISITPMETVENQSGGGEAYMPDMVQKWISEGVMRGFEAGRHQHRQSSIRAEAPVQGTFQHISSQRELLSQQSDPSSDLPSETDD